MCRAGKRRELISISFSFGVVRQLNQTLLDAGLEFSWPSFSGIVCMRGTEVCRGSLDRGSGKRFFPYETSLFASVEPSRGWFVFLKFSTSLQGRRVPLRVKT